MLRTIFLLLPVFISMFWAITLAGGKSDFSTPRRFLSRIMLIPAFLFIGHFLYFAPYPNVYAYFEFPQAVAGMLFFPFYHSYFRLLTIDEKFNWRNQKWSFLLPILLTLLYGVAILFTPKQDFRDFLFHEGSYEQTPMVSLLKILRTCIRIGLLVQLILCIDGNARLIRKFGDKAGHFYSDLHDTSSLNSKILNYSLLFMSIATFIALILGRAVLMPSGKLIYFLWSAFSISLFLIGLLGFRQKPINPTFESETDSIALEIPNEPGSDLFDNLSIRILSELKEKKSYLNPQLSILDVAKMVGSNRTYVSKAINKAYNLNFCSFINDLRITELEQILIESPNFSAEKLSELCGFGSINSMNRAISSKTGQTFKAYKSSITSR